MKIKILIKKIFIYFMRLYKKFIDDGCQVFASSIAFYSVLSIFPALLIFISLSGVVINKFSIQPIILVFVKERIPMIYGFVDNNITNIVKNRTTIGIIGFLIMFIASTYVFDSIQLALNKIFRTEIHRKFWKQKIYGFLIIFLIFFSVVITFSLSTGLFYLSNTLIDILNIEEFLSTEILKLLSIAIGIFFNFLIFILIYYFDINKKINFRQIYRGALTVAVGLEGVKHLFVFYLDRFASYQLTYGSIGSVIAFLSWIYISSMILLLGAEINSLRFKI
ncbi:MAG: YihY/virulence factor BrkB family protein [Actinobacteria bacterium]|nr:YihY/virulence factor BrkB family protein [Actinomycetota bacterium]